CLVLHNMIIEIEEDLGLKPSAEEFAEAFPPGKDGEGEGEGDGEVEGNHGTVKDKAVAMFAMFELLMM
ncbi:hypothetical protein M404DRAFT_156033, partial [Pisolithus tinctorius Marx 270]